LRARHLIVCTLMCGLAAGWAPLVAKKADEPDVVTVQHILIGFKKTVPNKKLERTKKEAETLALELLERAKAGEDFDGLVKQYTDDSHPGIYVMTNFDMPKRGGGLGREAMVTRFGDVAFSLEVGEVGLAKYHYGSSPYGWHVIKRLE